MTIAMSDRLVWQKSPASRAAISTARSSDAYLLGSNCIATVPEPSSSRLTSFKSMRFESPANNVGP
jgi:hypothetical protein